MILPRFVVINFKQRIGPRIFASKTAKMFLRLFNHEARKRNAQNCTPGNFSSKDEATLTADEILLIRRSWKMLRGIDPAIVGGTFYGKLFSDNPSLQKMFSPDMHQQYQKLVEMISIIVARLDRMPELANDIALMAQRHHQYGVRPLHYKMVGDALLWTLEQGLGTGWTEAVKLAWVKCYGSIAGVMVEAAEEGV
jgi:hemoglobin-like flavoprotein